MEYSESENNVSCNNVRNVQALGCLQIVADTWIPAWIIWQHVENGKYARYYIGPCG